MILGTFQPADWQTSTFKGYEGMREALGIPDDKPLYWCFAANNIQQAVVNAYCTEPFIPETLIFFETDNYYPVDKIRWERTVQDSEEDISCETIKENGILEITHPETAIYVTTEIPNKCFAVRIDSPKEFMEDMEKWCIGKNWANYTDFQKSMIMATIYGGEDSVFLKMCAFHSAGIEYMTTACYLPEFEVTGNPLVDERLNILKINKTSFEGTLYPMTYLLGRALCFGDEESTKEQAGTTEYNVVSPVDNINLHNQYAMWNMTLPDKDDETAYRELISVWDVIGRLTLRKKFVFTGNVGVNEPCPCGSGKKYKKCCKDDRSFDTYKYMCEGIL